MPDAARRVVDDLVGRGETGTRDDRHAGATLSAASRPRSRRRPPVADQRLAQRAHHPQGMALHDGEPASASSAGGRADPLPATPRRGPPRPCRSTALTNCDGPVPSCSRASPTVSDDRRVRGHAHAEQLVDPEPQDVERGRVDRADLAVRRLGDDRVVPAAQPQRAVGELGGERRVPAGDPALAQQRRQHQVGVRVGAVDGAQDVERGGPRRVAPPAALRRRGGRPLRPALRPARHRAGGRSGRRRSSAGLMPQPPSTVSDPRRAPRAQSAAAIARLPCGLTSVSAHGVPAGPDEHLLLAGQQLPRRQVGDVGDGNARAPGRAGSRPAASSTRPARGCSRGPAGRPRAPGATSAPARPRPRSSARGSHRPWTADGAEDAVLEGVERRTSSPAPATASRPSRSPAVSRGPDRLGEEPEHRARVQARLEPERRGAGTSSPAMIACCTGAAPRQAGSTEKCRLTQPWGGTSSSAGRDQRAVGDDRGRVDRELGQPRLESASRGRCRRSGPRDRPPGARLDLARRRGRPRPDGRRGA